jgi:hypothetical protein
MVSIRRLWALAGGLSLAVFGQNALLSTLKTSAAPGDPLELVTGQVNMVDTPESRHSVEELLERARNSYALRSGGFGYDLKVRFAVNSGGQTDYDGAWNMEDVFDPQQGFRWSAKASSGYTTTEISANQKYYAEGTPGNIPLRLHEARAALFGPMGTTDGQVLRLSQANYNGAQVFCVLISRMGTPASTTPGRHWEESEECVDPQSGLLMVHSQVPGRYSSYDYSNAPRMGNHALPRKVTVMAGGRVVSEITVESLTPLASADPSLFAPTAEMTSKGPSIAMAGAQKVTRWMGRLREGATAQPVVVFGLVTPTGQLVEAHSLQPSDPNSQTAVEAAKRMNFAHPSPAGSRPEQHFVFVIEKFVAAQ